MNSWLELAALLGAAALAGGLTGAAMGALRVGGGGFALALLCQMLPAAGAAPPAPAGFQLCLGAALLAVTLLSAQAAAAHWRSGALDVETLRRWAPAAALGGLAAGVGAALLSPALVAGAAGATLLAAGARLLLDDGRAIAAPGRVLRFGLGAGLGAVSAMGALGGGATYSALLARLGEGETRRAAAGAALGALACGAALLPLALLAPTAAAPFSLGAVNLPAGLAAAAAAAGAAPFGARAARSAPGGVIRAAAAFLLCVSGLALL
ncbi:TSUP family transporter [Rubrimonas cliftonensis]|uniref:Probable membrane transporter protein n=1 Tax=Rubrimonas cliftonensis TaxID=89524 RepID=A0A1H4F410_9RHOB|nr:TSUP family transporter [Rubrimonas cliftonensis]SEA91971.1 Sulfite exporter TauE/SafE [Rubrimonas cliftonensis]